MQYDQIIQQALRDAQDVLSTSRYLPNDRTVLSLRAIISKPEVGLALERASDTASCFALRAINRVLSEARQPPGPAINRILDIMDQLNRALGIAHNSRMLFWGKKPPGR